MSSEGFVPVTVDTYGGLCTLMDRSDLPLGLSPDCSNVEFFPGGVRSRSGLLAYATFDDWVVGVDSYVNTSGVSRRLVLTRTPILYSEQHTQLTPIWNPLEATPTPGYSNTIRLQSTTLFGRQFICVSDGTRGIAPVKQYDGTNLSAVGQGGPDQPLSHSVAPGGNVSLGKHYVCVAGISSTGFTTPLGIVREITVNPGGQTITLTDIPVLPGDIARKRVFISPAGGGEMYSLQRFVIDNDVTTLVISATDAEIATGAPSSEFATLIPVDPQLGVAPYHNRLVYWGGRTHQVPFTDSKPYAIANAYGVPVVVGLVDLGFDARAASLSSAWTSSVSGASILPNRNGANLQAVALAGNGVATKTAWIYQQQLNLGDSGVYYVTPGKRYGVRARIRSAGLRATDSVVIALSTVTTAGAATNVATLSKTGASLTNFWEIYSSDGLSNIPNEATYVRLDAYLQGSTAIPVTSIAEVDSIEIYVVESKDDNSLARVSLPYDPESLEAQGGWISVAEGNGQALRCVFELRGNLYLAKERSLYVTIDNGDVPATWTVDEISNVVGTPSVRGVAAGDGYVIIAGEAGVYMFTGGAPEKMSQEIESLWARVNWVYGHKLWVALDPRSQKVWIGVPLDGATEPNTILVLDFVEGWGSPIPSGNGRKWATYSGIYLCGSITTRDDGSRAPMLGTQTSVTLENRLASATNFSFPSPWSVSVGANPTVTTSVSDPISTSSASNWSTAYTSTERVWSVPQTTVANDGDYVFGAIWVRSTSLVPPALKVRVGCGGLYTEAAAQSYGTWRCIRVVHHPAKAGTPYLAVVVPAGTGVFSLDVWGAQLKSGPIGQVWTGIVAGGVTGTTKYPLVEPVSGAPYDSTGAFEARYETAPLGTELGRSLFDRLIMRIRGTGVLQTSLIRPSGQAIVQPTANFRSAPNDDVEIRCHQIDTQLGIRWKTDTVLDQWSLRRAGILMRPSEHSVFRGKRP